MKFGGTSVADAERIAGAAEIVESMRSRQPLVVVSALAGVTDLLEQTFSAARRGDRVTLEKLLSELGRLHRWAISGSVDDPGERHHLGLEVDRLFEELRERLRSIRILEEGTPRVADAVFAFGESVSSRIVTAAFRGRGLPAVWVDPREVMLTDDCHGSAEPQLDRVREVGERELLPRLVAGEILVTGGFVGATSVGETTTLGRGGSDTSAAVLGATMGAEEIQIWTDVDGLMSADPRWVPGARTIPRISFAEAVELASHGARVLHPDSLAPAVRLRIPITIRNSLHPAGASTMVLDRDAEEERPTAVSIASRSDVTLVRFLSRRLRVDPGFLPEVLAGCRSAGATPDFVLGTGVAITACFREGVSTESLLGRLGEIAEIEVLAERAWICVVGGALRGEGEGRARVLTELARWSPEALALGGGSAGVTAVLPRARLQDAVRGLHRRFFEEGENR